MVQQWAASTNLQAMFRQVSDSSADAFQADGPSATQRPFSPVGFPAAAGVVVDSHHLQDSPHGLVADAHCAEQCFPPVVNEGSATTALDRQVPSRVTQQLADYEQEWHEAVRLRRCASLCTA
jgi:hypothetical protein